MSQYFNTLMNIVLEQKVDFEVSVAENTSKVLITVIRGGYTRYFQGSGNDHDEAAKEVLADMISHDWLHVESMTPEERHRLGMPYSFLDLKHEAYVWECHDEAQTRLRVLLSTAHVAKMYDAFVDLNGGSPHSMPDSGDCIAFYVNDTNYIDPGNVIELGLDVDNWES